MIRMLKMVKRRQLLIAGSRFAIASLPASSFMGSQDQIPQAKVGQDGAPRIIEGGVVQFKYNDGTVVRVYDDKIETTRPDQKTEIRAPYQIGTPTLSQPAVPSDVPLKKWLDRLAVDLRATIKGLLNNDSESNKNYDAWENKQSLTIYKVIAVRLEYIKRLSGLK
jgi:hypothetical protein